MEIESKSKKKKFNEISKSSQLPPIVQDSKKRIMVDAITCIKDYLRGQQSINLRKRGRIKKRDVEFQMRRKIPASDKMAVVYL
jgi:hypothetical protein